MILNILDTFFVLGKDIFVLLDVLFDNAAKRKLTLTLKQNRN
jgi:hypothetical protein